MQRTSEAAVFILLEASRPSQLVPIMFVISRGCRTRENKDYFAGLEVSLSALSASAVFSEDASLLLCS